MNIYELTGAYLQIQNLIEDGEDYADTLESIDDAIEDKAVGYAQVMKNLEGYVAALKTEETRLSDKRKSIENNIKRLKETLQEAMELTGKEKFKTPLFNFNIQNNPPSAQVDEKQVDEKYLIPQPPKVDKKAIIADLKEGKEVKGAVLTQGRSLRIR